MRSDDARRQPAPLEHARDHPRRSGAWFGFEQEYFFYKDGRPLGFPSTGYPAPQGPYYTGVGYKNVGDIARKMVDEHLDLCIFAGINHEGINAEVAKGQWEFLRFSARARKRLPMRCGWLATSWSGWPKNTASTSSITASRSATPTGTAPACTPISRRPICCETGGKAYFEASMEAFKAAKDDHIAVYGPDNHMRLTGKHETAAIT